jgi:signal transduction histidine kinase
MLKFHPSGGAGAQPAISGDLPSRSFPHNGPSLSTAALDLMTEPVIALGKRQEITYCNPAAEALYGIAAAAVIGRPFSEIIACRPFPPAAATRASSGLANGPAVHSTLDGAQLAVRVSCIKCGDSAGPHRYIAIIRDDRQHVRLADTFEHELRFERLVANLSARFSSIAEELIDGEIEVWLRRLVEILEVDRSSFAELSPRGDMLVTHTYAAAGTEPYPKVVANDRLPWLITELLANRSVVLARIPDDLPESARAERAYMAASGMTSGVAIPLQIGGAVIGALTFGSFRGEREWSSAELSRLQLAGEVFANALFRRQAKQRLERKQLELAHVGRVAAMAELASVIAHELDQPLTAVVSNAQAVRFLLECDDPDLVEVDAALHDVIDAAMRVCEIVRREKQLLRKSELKVEPIDINEIIREIELFIRAEAKQDGAKVSFELLPGLPPIVADRIQVQQVILNISRNGLQAMRAQPRQRRVLAIRTAARCGEVVVSVIDAGPRIDDELLQQIFDPFFTTRPDGLGMGLSIGKAIVERHHGRIWATRNDGDGISMHVAFPPLKVAHE